MIFDIVLCLLVLGGAIVMFRQFHQIGRNEIAFEQSWRENWNWRETTLETRLREFERIMDELRAGLTAESVNRHNELTIIKQSIQLLGDLIKEDTSRLENLVNKVEDVAFEKFTLLRGEFGSVISLVEDQRNDVTVIQESLPKIIEKIDIQFQSIGEESEVIRRECSDIREKAIKVEDVAIKKFTLLRGEFNSVFSLVENQKNDVAIIQKSLPKIAKKIDIQAQFIGEECDVIRRECSDIREKAKNELDCVREKFANSMSMLRSELDGEKVDCENRIETIGKIGEALQSDVSDVKRESSKLYKSMEIEGNALRTELKGNIEDQASRRYNADTKIERLVETIASDAYKLRDDIIKGFPHKSQKGEFGLLNAVLATGCLNSLGYQHFDRYMKPIDIAELLEKWNPILGTKVSATAMSYMADRICEVERSCSGRLATSIQNQCMRTLVFLGAGLQGNVNGIEVGTLYGLNLCMLRLCSRSKVENCRFTIIDPLEGYYGKDTDDILLELPVDERTFNENISKYFTGKEIRLIKKYSYENEVKTLLNGEAFNYAIIDGDHSYEGVEIDFLLLKPFIAPGGFLLFDDYGVKEWPGVKEFVDKVVFKDKSFEFLGHDWRTGVFRKK